MWFNISSWTNLLSSFWSCSWHLFHLPLWPDGSLGGFATAGNAVVTLMPLNSLSEPQALDTKNQHYKGTGPVMCVVRWLAELRMVSLQSGQTLIRQWSNWDPAMHFCDPNCKIFPFWEIVLDLRPPHICLMRLNEESFSCHCRYCHPQLWDTGSCLLWSGI